MHLGQQGHLSLQAIVHYQRKPGQQRGDRNGSRGHVRSLLSGLLPGSHSALLRSLAYLLMDGDTHSGLGTVGYINYQSGKCPIHKTRGQPDGGNS